MDDNLSFWSPPEPKTIINNEAWIIPPDFNEEKIHSLLMRFQYEENQYKLQHISSELQYFKRRKDKSLPAETDLRLKLVKENEKIIKSIEAIYPPFAYEVFMMKEPSEGGFSKFVQIVSKDQFQILFGDGGKEIRNIENTYHVQVKISSKPPETNDILANVLIEGKSEDDISQAFDYIESILFKIPQNKQNKTRDKPLPQKNYPWNEDDEYESDTS